MFRKITILTLSILLLSAFSFGQLNQTGSLRGVVTSPDGSPLPGVMVSLTSPKMILKKMETITNENGRYRFLGLYPGLYDITYTLEGMSTVVRKGIKVEVGKTFDVNVALQLGKIEENIIVEGQTPTIDRQSTTKAANLDSEYLASIPALRTINEFLNMTPGVNDNSAFGGSVRDNAYNLDGVNLNDPAVGTQGVFFGMDIMEEISVQTGGLSAQYSAKGANLNVVTKSGGNKLSGSAVVYYRHESLKSDNTDGTPLEGTESGAKYEFEPGFTLGGPIIKDKLWFFGNFSFNKRETFVNGYPLAEDLSGPADNSIARDDYRPYPYFKLTFQPGQDDKFYVSYNYSDIETDHRGATRHRTENATRVQTTPTHVVTGQWTHTFGTSLITNVKASIVRSKFDMETKTTLTPMYDAYTSNYWNNHAFTDRNQRDRTQINFDGTLFIEDFGGSHEIVAGGEMMFSETGRQIIYTGAEKDPISGWGTYVVAQYKGNPYYIDYDKPMDQKQKINIFSAFVNDTWNLTKQITLNLGLRFTHQRGIIPKQGLEDGVGFMAPHIFGEQYPYDTRVENEFTPLKWTDIAPRISAIYDLFSDGTTLIKASYSRYTGDMLSDYYGSMNPNQWLWYYGPAGADGVVSTVWDFSSVTTSKAKYKNHEAKSPYSDEIVFGIERELTNDISVSARFIKKWYKRNIEDVDANALDIDKLLEDGDLVWTNYERVTTTDPHTGQDVTFWNRKELKNPDVYILNPPGADRKYTGFEISLNKRFSNNWSFNMSYVYSKNEGLIGTSFNRTSGINGIYNDPNSHVNADGRDEQERAHVVKAAGMVRIPFDINVGFFANYRSGLRTTRTVSSRALDVDLSQGNTTVNAEERGSYKLPNRFTFDIKIEKVFRIGKFNLRGFVDIFNVFNEGKSTGVWTNSSTAGGNNPELWEMRSISDPRIFRLGAKFEF